eukprot:3138557-Prymnesium_polylepis.1
MPQNSSDQFPAIHDPTPNFATSFDSLTVSSSKIPTLETAAPALALEKTSSRLYHDTQRQITPGEIPGSLRGRWRLPRRASVRLLTP